MGLAETAPLLSLIWPYAMAVGSGVALMKVIDYWRNTGFLFNAGNRRNSRKKSVTFAPVGKPRDEDNYVFRDDDADEIEIDDRLDDTDKESELPHVSNNSIISI